jgi:hypothetical protein
MDMSTPPADGNGHHLPLLHNIACQRLRWQIESEEHTSREAVRELTRERYRRAINKALGSDVLYVVHIPEQNCLLIKIRGGIVVDFGDRIAVENGTEKEINAMLRLMQLKEWSCVEFSGSIRFRERASLESVRHHFQVTGYEMPEHVRQQLQHSAPVAPATKAPPRPTGRAIPARVSRARRKAPAPVRNEAVDLVMVESIQHYVEDMLTECPPAI